MKKRLDWAALHEKISRNQETLIAEHSSITICIPELSAWDYAIPENYTNYQDGFIVPDFVKYRRAMPLFDHPRHGRLYFRWEVPFFLLKATEREKYLCFDRRGNKYTVIIQHCPEHEGGNPSYFRFLPKVKKYAPKRKERNGAST